MTKHIHGGDVYKHKDCLDFSANLNPLGTPESVKQAIIHSLDHIAQYPQVGCGVLRERIAESEGVKAEEVICGNGAAEVIFTLCHAVKPKRALIPAPTFAEYGQALASTGCELEYYMLTENDGFVLSEAYLDILHKGLDMAFLCNPNNPTGMLIPHRLLKRILEKCRKLDILLVVVFPLGVVGAGIAIEKVFQGGGDLLRQQGLRIESLARIAAMSDDSLSFC